MATVFCGSCGEKIKKEDLFCVFCGTKKEREEENPNNNANGEVLSLQHFQENKSKERISRFAIKRPRPSPSPSSSTLSADTKRPNKSTEAVLINVGIIRENDRGIIKIVRGSKLPVQVPRNANVETILKLSLKKHAEQDQYFCASEDYVLIYPDKKKVETIPGTKTIFSLDAYKKNLGKPYSKLDLFLCQPQDLYKREDEVEDDIPVLSNVNVLTEPKTWDLETGMENNFDPDIFFNHLNDITVDTNDVAIASSESASESSNNAVLTSSTSSLVSNFGHCPICNKKFKFDVIEEHADQCLQKKERIIIESDSEGESHPEELKTVEIDTDMVLIDLKKEMPGIIRRCNILSEEEIRINVRRLFEFEDFVRFFGKRWNRQKLNAIYKITYLGEPAVDTGGVSREFYSGKMVLTNI